MDASFRASVSKRFGEFLLMVPKAKLYTADKRFVADADVLPYKFWPQGLIWGQRFFVREDCLTDLSCERDSPPDYYEVSFLGTILPEWV